MNSSQLHPTLFSSSLEKPQDHILNLIKTLSPHAQVVPADKLSTLDFVRTNTKQCYLLEEGHVIINRRDDGITLNTESAPFVFGFTLNSKLHPRLCIRPSSDAVLRRLSLESAMHIVEEESLWEPLTQLLIFISARLFRHCTRLSQSGMYETVRSLLIELINESPKIRYAESTYNYIQNRCLLSRSGIMSILSSLRTGGHIELENGKLVKINYLPDKI
ncbi:helix-turn-helix domain-containing protein [Lelliottia amnigena]|uniref:helix-turn-helix domain-containing protein n=1 Tax=Lelliottia amnigena TaxID=61646 RepID=UPI0021DA7F2E|nr:helix-turn-helix domain-containing protein [Lelliottia amnigena]MCU7783264.1 helix-turn-helix domain-containing protein [Lelliottia amnigena]